MVQLDSRCVRITY